MKLGDLGLDDETSCLLAFQEQAVSGLELDMEERRLRVRCRWKGLTTWIKGGISGPGQFKFS